MMTIEHLKLILEKWPDAMVVYVRDENGIVGYRVLIEFKPEDFQYSPPGDYTWTESCLLKDFISILERTQVGS